MQAVTDYPAALFYRELIDTYPEAKVILTNRNVDSWYEYVSQICTAVRRSSKLMPIQIDPPHHRLAIS